MPMTAMILTPIQMILFTFFPLLDKYISSLYTMRGFQQRRRLRNLFFSRPVFAVFLCLVVLLTFSVFKVYKKSRHAILRNRVVEEEIEELKRRKVELEANISRLDSEEGIEEELRQRLQIKKPGEEYVVILENKSDERGKSAREEKKFFEKLWDFLKF
jgi:cell division protein FtsB